MDRRRIAGWTARHPDATDLLVSVVFGLVVGLGTVIQRGTEPNALLAAVSLGAGTGLAVGWAMRRRRDREARAAQALLEHRLEIARELHDVVAHHISVIGIQAAAARRHLDGPPAETAAALSAIEASSRAAITDMQRMVTILRRPGEGSSDDRPGTVRPEPPPPGLADLAGLLDRMRTTGLRIDCDDGLAVAGADGTVRWPLSAASQVALYRVAQEALTNARRHAGPVDVRIVLRLVDDVAELAIENDAAPAGPGAPARADDAQPAAAGPAGGMGLPGMRERLQAVGGTLAAGPIGRGGFVVVARVPVEAT